jgi:ribosome modulation factor
MAQDFSLRWDIDTLNKAYRHGYMSGVMGADQSKRPAMSDVVAAAWEAGWEDGIDVCQVGPSVAEARIAS